MRRQPGPMALALHGDLPIVESDQRSDRTDQAGSQVVDMAEATMDIGVIKSAVSLACRAPSLHNRQPWRWVADGATLDLFADPDRIRSATDRSGREVFISCGAVLDHLAVAMAAAGWQANTNRFPNRNDPTHLASIDFSALGFVTDAQRDRAGAILQRRTDRLPFEAPANWGAFEPVLRAAVDSRVAMLDVIADRVRHRLADASRLTEKLRRDDASYHAELAWWTSRVDAREGVPTAALASETEAHRVDVGRHFPPSGHGERRPEIDRDHSKILVLSTYDDTRRDAVGCGEVLSTVLLEATMAGLATCTLTHMIEIAHSRAIVGELTRNNGFPQVLIRVGTAPDPKSCHSPTPRRPLPDVLKIRA